MTTSPALAQQITEALASRFQVQIDGTQVHSAFTMGDSVWTDCGTKGQTARVDATVTCARCAKKIAKMQKQAGL